ncbi:hypothetical protein BCR32DRAFT_270709 [Anaeromyces robustus]|uniref:RGS domain-containing protein n=1 Tax=Anaeromyces robustus TaxID=1754192 RepID=A0A1Y1WVW8_9FUNG|nr:hypothetical protein BCR32DRAFT_270709 [Anaeromyces robustus]|eukprot:ORX77346.1 hypothetical protein BCR32DRAFT_270709 [Anaeromyces robustus]
MASLYSTNSSFIPQSTLPSTTSYYASQPTLIPNNNNNNMTIPYSFINNTNTSNTKIRLSKLEDKIYFGINIFCILYFIIPLVWIYFYRNSMIVKQRSFVLTFIGGISSFLSAKTNLASQNYNVSCAFTYYSRVVFMFIAQVCFVSRAFRLILLYRANRYKVKRLNQKEFLQKTEKGYIEETNIYYKSISKYTDKKFVFLFMPFIIIIDFLIGYYFKKRFDKKNICNWKGNYNLNDKILLYSQFSSSSSSNIPESYRIIYESMNNLFNVPKYLSRSFIVLYFIILIIFIFTEIKDDQKFGIKFDCFSNAIISLLTQLFHEYLSTNHAKNMIAKKIDPIYTINNLTKNGIVFLVFVDFFIQLTSVIIPLGKCIQEKRMNKKYYDDHINTIQYFYKILESPSFMEELKNIAVQEFVAQNILFWKNYCTLRRITIRSIIRYEERYGNQNTYNNNNKYKYKNYNDYNNYNNYYLNDNKDYSNLNSNSEFNFINNPYYPILPELLPYYNAFYTLFIDPNGPGKVNISEFCRQNIYQNLNNHPVIGIFDEAKNEVVESMYHTIFPRLLQNNRKQIQNLLY